MWIFTKYGFFSVVEKGDQLSGPGEKDVVVRSRAKGHLGCLLAHFPDDLDGAAIEEYVGTDYPYRIRVTRQGWQALAGRLAEEVNYDNFKDEAARWAVRRDPADEAYLDQLYEVYGAMCET